MEEPLYIEPGTLIWQKFVTVVETTQFFLWCFTVPFYAFILFFMIEAQKRRIKELNTPFFKLCISTAIIDLVTLFNNYFGLMFPKRGIFPHIYLFLDSYYAHVYLYFAWSTGICQAMSVSILATNRLSAIILPNQYHKMWHGRRLRIAYAVQFIPGCVLGLLTFFNETVLVRNETNGILPKFINATWTLVYFSVGGAFLLSNCLYLILAYCYLLKVLRKRSSSLGSSNFSTTFSESFKKREKRLFIMCSIIVSVQLTILLFFIVKLSAPIKMSIDDFYMFYAALSDLFASINPYLLWIFSDYLRKYILRKIGLQKPTTPLKTIVLSSYRTNQ